MAIGAISANADNWVRDAEPAILEVHFNNWWKFKHSNFAAKMNAAYGVGPKATPEDNKPKIVHYDKEETDYPHDL